MAISYLLAPIPKWIIIGNDGLTAGGAKLYTKSSLDKVADKPVYQDPAGTIPWTNPIVFDANGTKGPFYWKTDSANPLDTYYLEVYDANNNLLWTLDDYFPSGGGGGGGSTTTYLPLRNLIANNVFIDHIDDTANPTNTTNLVIAPSNHHGFTPDLINPVSPANGTVGPDIRFVKNNTTAADEIKFEDFALGINPFTGDVTPVQYLRYICNTSPAGETLKAFQFPINQKVHNLENQRVTFTIWAKVAVTPVTLTLFTRQYFGSGGSPSGEILSSVGTLSLSTAWQAFNVQFTIPNIAGGTVLGTTGDDALYLQLGMPLGVPCDVWFTKPSLFLGEVGSAGVGGPGFADFDTYDEIDSVTQTPRTGDIITSMRGAPRRGWVAMNDRTIGSASSGATNRANIDTFPLFKTIWDAVSNTWAPLQDSAGVATARGATAVADFSANRRLTLTRQLGRVLMGGNSSLTTSISFTAVAATSIITMGSSDNFPTGTPITVAPGVGGVLPAPLVANTVYYLVNLTASTYKLADSVDHAQATVPVTITLTTNGTPPNNVLSPMGAFLGEGKHQLTVGELARHTHPGAATITGNVAGSSANGITFGANNQAATLNVTNLQVAGDGLDQAHNTIQPSTITNVFIKL